LARTDNPPPIMTASAVRIIWPKSQNSSPTLGLQPNQHWHSFCTPATETTCRKPGSYPVQLCRGNRLGFPIPLFRDSKRSGHKDQSCITSNTLLCSALRSAWRASRRHARRSLSESGSERFTPLPDMTTTATMTAATTIPTTTIPSTTITIPGTTATLMPRPRAPTATTATILMHVPLTDTTGLTTS
jgi:hypothetical protein